MVKHAQIALSEDAQDAKKKSGMTWQEIFDLGLEAVKRVVNENEEVDVKTSSGIENNS